MQVFPELNRHVLTKQYKVNKNNSIFLDYM